MTLDLSLPAIGSIDSYDRYMQSIRAIPSLTAEEEMELGMRLKKSNDLEAAKTLILSHLKLVAKVAKGYAGYGLPQSDLVQEGNIGLMKAVKRFDPERGVRLVSFAIYWIKAEIQEYIVKNWRLVKTATTKAQRKLFFNLRSMKKTLQPLKSDEIKDLEHLNDLLLPIVKGYGSERAWTLLGTESLQTFGGSGFTQDWPLEQYVRDAKIDTLYEGTTAIQGLDFFFRKIVKDNGRALTKLAKEIGKVAASGGNNATEKAALAKALEDMQGIIGQLVTHALASQENPSEIYKCGLNTSRLLMAVGDVIISWLLLRQAEIAATKIGSATGKEKDFYEGKIAAARYFIHNFLPLITATRAIVEREDGEIMKVSEAAF